MRSSVFIIAAVLITNLMWSSQALGKENAYSNLHQIEFRETPLSVVIDFFRSRSAEGKWTKYPINFVVHPKVDQKQLISLRLKDIPIGIAIIYMIDSADLDYKIANQICHILPRGEGELAKRPPYDPKTVANFPPAKEVLKPFQGKVEFNEAPIQMITDYISKRQGINLVLNQRIDPEIPISIKRSSISSGNLLRSIADMTALELRIEQHAIFLDPPGTQALHLARIKTAELEKNKSAPRQPRKGRGYDIGTYPNDPRSPVHPDYVNSTDPDISKRTNALNNVYKWVNGKWTFVRAGSSAKNRGLRTSSLETDK